MKNFIPYNGRPMSAVYEVRKTGECYRNPIIGFMVSRHEDDDRHDLVGVALDVTMGDGVVSEVGWGCDGEDADKFLGLEYDE